MPHKSLKPACDFSLCAAPDLERLRAPWCCPHGTRSAPYISEQMVHVVRFKVRRRIDMWRDALLYYT